MNKLAESIGYKYYIRDYGIWISIGLCTLYKPRMYIDRWYYNGRTV